MKTVLIVEPSKDDRNYLARIANRMGCRHLAAENGAEGLEALDRTAASVVLCSEDLPDMPPGRFVEAVRKPPGRAALPLLLLSSRNDAGAKAEALRTGFSEAVAKPFSVRSLYHQLEGVLSEHRRKQIRVPMVFPVGVTHLNTHRSLRTAAFGEGGMFLATEDPVAAQRTVHLDFDLPKMRRSCSLDADVLYNLHRASEELPPGMGLRFLDLPEVLRMVFGIFLVNHLVRATPMA